MKPVRLFALVLFGASLLPGAGRAAENVGLPEQIFPQLDQILRAALQQSPRIVARNLDLVVADGDEIQAKAGQYPNASGYVSFSEANESRGGIAGSFATQIFNYNLAVSQPAWHWGSVRNSARIGEIRRKIAGQQYRDAYRMLAQEIRAGYLNLIISKAAAENAAFYLKLVEDRLQVAEERLSKGTISAGDIFRPRIEAQQTRLATDRVMEEYANNRRLFGVLTGAAPLGEDDIPTGIPTLNGDEDSLARLLGSFLSQKDPENSSTIVARQQLESERLNLAIQRKRLYPMFNFTAGVYQTRQSYSLDVSQLYRVRDAYVGVAMTWSIFDGLATHGAVKSSLARVQQLDGSYRELTKNLPKDTQHSEKQTEFALRQMRIDDRLFDERGTFLQAREGDFKRGIASQADLDAARQSFYGAEIAAFNSRAAYLRQLGEFLGMIMADPVLDQIKTGAHE